MKIYLHIGDARTGSSTLQAVMTRNRARLQERGIDYPVLGTREGKGVAHHMLSFSLLPVWPAHSPIPPVPPEDIWTALVDHLNTSTAHSLVLSSEAFLNLPEASIAFIKDALRGHDVIPICVRREPEDWRRSWMAHRIRHGEVVPPPQTPARDLAAPKIDRWRAQFDVVTVPYSDAVLRDVLEVIGVDLAMLEPISRRNESCSDAVLQLLNQLNAIDLNEANRPNFLALANTLPRLQEAMNATSLDDIDRVSFNAMVIEHVSL